MINIIAVFIGGGIGASARYLTGLIFSGAKYGAPAGTLCVNIIASFILGFCFEYFSTRTNIPPHIKLTLTCGFCGGLSTFSTFALEGLQMFSTSVKSAIIYILLSIVLCILSTAIGIFSAKII